MKHAFGKAIPKMTADEDEVEENPVDEGGLGAPKREKGLDPDFPYIPEVPTTGWMLSELDRHGIYLRGQPGIMKKRSIMVKKLRELGYDVHVGAADAKKHTKEDR